MTALDPRSSNASARSLLGPPRLLDVALPPIGMVNRDEVPGDSLLVEHPLLRIRSSPAIPGLGESIDRGDQEVNAVLASLRRKVDEGRGTNIGFPGASDIDYSPITPFFSILLNNVGDPWTDPGGSAHTKAFEREVLDWFGALLGARTNDRWGYLTSGGTEGNLYGLRLARTRHPDAMVYYSKAAHYSVPKSLDILGLASETVAVDDWDELDYADLGRLIAQHPGRPAIVVANIGTTMTEAVDDVNRILEVLTSHGVPGHHIHADAALAGVPLALDPAGTSPLRLGSTIDTISISGHKFFGTPIPCGVVLATRSHREHIGRHVEYTATLDSTITGSRCGQAALLLWYVIQRYGVDGLCARVHRARDVASYAAARLTAAGWPAWRHSHAFTVVLRTPSREVTDLWTLATSGDWSHIICMPGITHHQIDAFIADLTVVEELRVSV